MGLKSEMELKAAHFKDNHGKGLLGSYNGSPAAVINSLREGDEGEQVEGKLEFLNSRRPNGYWVLWSLPTLPVLHMLIRPI